MNENKAPGMIRITAKLLLGGREVVVKAMHTVVTKIQQEEEVQEDWAKSKIVAICKQKDKKKLQELRSPKKVFTKMSQSRIN